MDQRDERQFPRWVAEFVLIVAGVSVALAADSAWNVFQDRAREGEYLEQLSEDLAENLRRLENALALEESQQVAATTAFEAVASNGEISADSARSWLVERRGLFYSDPRLLTGTFSALLSTGDIQLLREPTVRQGVIDYLPKMEADKAEFDRWVDRLVQYDEILRRLGLLVGEATTVPDDPSIQALTVRPRSPEVLVALDGVLYTNWVRRTYLQFMLESTIELGELLNDLPR